MSVLELKPTDAAVVYEPPLMAHVGCAGDRHALCGAPTLGIRARRDAELCTECDRLWDAMSWRARWRFTQL